MPINKFQSGGFMIYQPLPMGQSPEPVSPLPSGSTEQKSNTAPEMIPEAIIKNMLGNGLTNDVIAFKGEIDKAYATYNNMSDLEKNSQFGNHLVNIMKGDFAKLNKLQRAKKDFDIGVKRIEENDAVSDYAITNNGVVVKNMKTGQLGEVSHKDYASKYRDSGEYKMLTNAELLTERENNQHLVGDLHSLEVMKNAIGMDKVRDKVREVLTNLGSDSRSRSSNMIFAGSPSQVASGATQLLSGMDQTSQEFQDTVDYLRDPQYFKQGQSSAIKSNTNQLRLAAETMWTNLDPNAKSLLRARAVASGATGSDIENVAKSNAISLLSPAYSTEESSSYEIDYESGMNSDRRQSSKDAKESTAGIGYYSQVMANQGTEHNYKITIGEGNDFALDVRGETFGAIQEKGVSMGPTMVRDLTDVMSLVNGNSVTIGDQTLTRAQTNALRYDGKSLSRVNLPVTINTKGVAVPQSQEVLEKHAKMIEELEAAVKRNPNVTAVAKEQIIRKYGFSPVRKGNDVVPNIQTADFLAFEATINERALPKGGSKNKLLEKVGRQEEKVYYSNYEYGTNKSENEKKERVAGATDAKDSWFVNPDVYRGVVYMLMTNPQGHIPGSNLDGTKPLVDKKTVSYDNLSRGTYRTEPSQKNYSID